MVQFCWKWMYFYMIKNIGWTLGNDCPCKCKHCYSFSVRQKGQNLTKEIVDVKKIDRIW